MTPRIVGLRFESGMLSSTPVGAMVAEDKAFWALADTLLLSGARDDKEQAHKKGNTIPKQPRWRESDLNTARLTCSEEVPWFGSSPTLRNLEKRNSNSMLFL